MPVKALCVLSSSYLCISSGHARVYPFIQHWCSSEKRLSVRAGSLSAGARQSSGPSSVMLWYLKNSVYSIITEPVSLPVTCGLVWHSWYLLLDDTRGASVSAAARQRAAHREKAQRDGNWQDRPAISFHVYWLIFFNFAQFWSLAIVEVFASFLFWKSTKSFPYECTAVHISVSFQHMYNCIWHAGKSKEPQGQDEFVGCYPEISW